MGLASFQESKLKEIMAKTENQQNQKLVRKIAYFLLDNHLVIDSWDPSDAGDDGKFEADKDEKTKRLIVGQYSSKGFELLGEIFPRRDQRGLIPNKLDNKRYREFLVEPLRAVWRKAGWDYYDKSLTSIHNAVDTVHEKH